MDRLGRRLAVLTASLAVPLLAVSLLAAAGPAQAAPTMPPDPDPGSDGIPGIFIFFFVVALLAGIGITVWKLTTARSLARQSGMDPGLATKVTLLSDDGLEATYLAANLRRQQAADADPAGSPAPGPSSTARREPASEPKRELKAEPSAEDRLTKLAALRDRDLITSEEYDDRRKAIIDSL